MSRVIAAAFAAALVAAAIPTAASAGCYSCYTPQPCCYQQQYVQQVIPPQYRSVQETVMVSGPAASSPIARRRSIAP
jgi:hypothetical protein